MSAVEDKFRSGIALGNDDKTFLKEKILTSTRWNEIQSYIYIYAREFGKDEEIVDRANYFIRASKIPGLTATCLKVLADFWGMADEYVDELKNYLDYKLYEADWYDEVIVSVSFFMRHAELLSEDIQSRLDALLDEARAAGDEDLCESLQERSSEFRGRNT